MKKIVIQGLIIVMLFIATWMALAEIDWMSLFKVERFSTKTEEKLGDLFWDMFNKSGKEIERNELTLPVDSILSRICNSNNIDKSRIKMHIVESNEINAFALPGDHLILFTGLISDAQNESELAGVISHELAHMNMHHVMKKLIKEVGFSTLISMTTGNAGSEIIKETARILSSTAYDRNLEKEADKKAADYLINSDVSPLHFADFLARLADSGSEIETHLSWISTHPDSKARAEYILNYRQGEPKNVKAILTQSGWDIFKSNL